eukprot:c19849_g1_i2.p1 GENE.c19849_g1_i2~~c19849_g1_i2.p1  ORF type:complete len:199 (-),score=33.77 c19849_g1_i2:42-638(-)
MEKKSKTYDSICKIVVVGDSGAGKSSLIRRFAENQYFDEIQATIGIDFKTRRIMLEEKIWLVQLWDTGGQERFRSITSSLYRGCNGAILCCDLSKSNVTQDLDQWLQEIQKYSSELLPVLIVGTKSDLQQSATSDPLEEFARSRGIPYLKTSSKEGENVEEAFILMTKNLREAINNNLHKVDLTKSDPTANVSHLCCQ